MVTAFPPRNGANGADSNAERQGLSRDCFSPSFPPKDTKKRASSIVAQSKGARYLCHVQYIPIYIPGMSKYYQYKSFYLGKVENRYSCLYVYQVHHEV